MAGQVILALLGVFLGVLAGYWIGRKTTEEHKAGKFAFSLLRKACLLIVALTLLFFVYPELGWVAILLVAVGYSVARIPVIGKGRYFLISIALVLSSLFSSDALILVSSLFVVHSLVYGTQDVPAGKIMSYAVSILVMLVLPGLLLLFDGGVIYLYLASLLAGLFAGLK